MHHTQDLFISTDIVPLFNYTYNDDARMELHKILCTPLLSIEQINERQQILKSLLEQEQVGVEYEYRKVDYAEVYRFLLYFGADKLKKIDYLTFIFQKKMNNVLIGHYSQLIYFFSDIENAIKGNIEIGKFPKSYQVDLRFILNYLNDFKLNATKTKIIKEKLSFSSIQLLNAMILEKRKNGDTLLFFDKLNRFEALLAICKAIPKLGFHFATIGSSNLQLSGIFHPLIKDSIKNDVNFDSNVVLVTGSNMSGKSTLLKTIGLCVYFAHIGLPIPASTGQVPFYDNISIQINHSDDLKNGYSHFMNEIMNLKNVVENASNGQKCFAVFDELFKGTNHEDALAISQITLKGLSKIKDSLFLISTHISELQFELAKDIVYPLHIECILEDGIPQFSYKVKKGWSDVKIGQLLFKKIGLEDILK